MSGPPPDPEGPAPAGQVELLKADVAREIVGFERRRDDKWWWAVSSKAFLLLLGGTTTIALGLRANGMFGAFQERLAAYALVASAAATVVAAWEGFFDDRGLWITFNGAVMGLYKISARLKYELAGDQPPSRRLIDGLRQEYQLVLDTANSGWARSRSQAPNAPGAGLGG